MSELHLNFGAQPHERPGDDDAREARHQVLVTLLGAFADGELPPETASQIDAHLLGCARCRREVALHASVHARLSREPLQTASAAFRERIIQELSHKQQADTVYAAGAVAAAPWWRTRPALLAMAAVIVVAAAALSIDRLRAPEHVSSGHTAAVDASSVPLLNAVLTDYRRATAGDLPGRARDLDAVRAAVPFPVEPMHGTAVRLLAAWSTDLEGEPSAVLAYRWHDQLVLEYLVAEPVFFRHPSVRAPIAAGGAVTARSGMQGVLAWAAPESGVILVGDVPVAELTALRLGGAAR